MNRIINVQALAAALATVFLSSACASEPSKPLVKDVLIEKTATVQAVYMPTRMVTLRGEDGKTTNVVAGPEVKNLDQVQVGDRVHISYYTGLAAELKKKGESVKGVEGAVTDVSAQPGERPAGGVGAAIRTTVTIESVDKSFKTVTFKREDGVSRTVAAETPEGEAFIKTLRPGDEVEITYTEALAVEVKPAS